MLDVFESNILWEIISSYSNDPNPLVPRVAYLLHEPLGGTNSKINVCFVFFPSVECLLHWKVIIRYRNIVIIAFCGYLFFSRKCQPPWNLSGKNITDEKIKLYDHTATVICLFLISIF
jgi:hypothetical protein